MKPFIFSIPIYFSLMKGYSSYSHLTFFEFIIFYDIHVQNIYIKIYLYAFSLINLRITIDFYQPRNIIPLPLHLSQGITLSQGILTYIAKEETEVFHCAKTIIDFTYPSEGCSRQLLLPEELFNCITRQSLFL